MTEHNIEPFFDENSAVLILGSFPSVASRETGFFYGHKQNRFWKVLAGVFGCDVPKTVEQKKTMLKEHRIALWDVIAKCDIVGSSDASIENVTVNDLSRVIGHSRVKEIFVNGRKAARLYQKYLADKYGEAVYLPSTSPANAAWSLQRLIKEWEKVSRCDKK